MGRGDKKTAKGKRFQGSFGKSRPKKTVSKHVAPAAKETVVTEEKAPKKAAKKSTKKATKSEDSEA